MANRQNLYTFAQALSDVACSQGPACWVRMPTGCNQQLAETQTPAYWFLDPYSPDSAMCTNRATAFNNYCGRSDAINQWGSKPEALEDIKRYCKTPAAKSYAPGLSTGASLVSIGGYRNHFSLAEILSNRKSCSLRPLKRQQHSTRATLKVVPCLTGGSCEKPHNV